MACAKLMLVDNDPAALSAAEEILRVAGYAVDQVLDARRALQRILADPPDLLITEILMPNVDGIELIAAAKRVHPGVRIIAVAGRRFLGGLDLLDVASKLGADATLDKPWIAQRLLGTVARLIDVEARPG